MILRKISMIGVLFLFVGFVSAQSFIHVEVTNWTEYEYVCTIDFYQEDAAMLSSSGPLTFTVPGGGNPTVVSHDYEFEDTDICLEEIQCEQPEDPPFGFIDVDCGQGLGTQVDIAPMSSVNQAYCQFGFTTWDYVPPNDNYYFDITE